MKKTLADFEISKEFHPTKNGNLKPEDFSYGSKKKIWWRCSVNPTHEWQATIKNRVNGTGCPFCTGQKPSKENNLSLHPVAKEFHYERNAPLTPEDFTLYSGRKIWWKCSKHPKHEWKAIIKNRVKQGDKCPICNNLAEAHYANEFNHERNYPKKVKDFYRSGSQKIWWKCDKGHEWEATINSRANGRNCPKCSKNGSSGPELEIIEFLKSQDLDYIHRFKHNNVEVDIFIPSKNLAIEYNGLYWHSEEKIGCDYHFDKFDYLLGYDIQTLFIWEDEWISHKKEILNQIESLLNGERKISHNYEKSFENCENKQIINKPSKTSFKVWGRRSFSFSNLSKSQNQEVFLL